MENLTLKKGPCSFLNLRKGPWEILFPFLLCSSSLSVLSFSWRLSLLCLGRRLFLPASSLGTARDPGGSRRWAAVARAGAGGRRAGAWACRHERAPSSAGAGALQAVGGARACWRERAARLGRARGRAGASGGQPRAQARGAGRRQSEAGAGAAALRGRSGGCERAGAGRFGWSRGKRCGRRLGHSTALAQAGSRAEVRWCGARSAAGSGGCGGSGSAGAERAQARVRAPGVKRR
jgi:hypothetical protein